MKGLEHLTWARLWGLIPSISFQWPLFLWLLLLVPLLVAAYILLLYRRKKSAFRYSNLRWSRKRRKDQAGAGMCRRP